MPFRFPMLSVSAVLLGILLQGISSIAQASENDPKKLNVLMIIIDDLAPVVSSFGGPVATPALDRLASQGTRFSKNYANVPVCGASRASLFSGLAPNAARFLTFDSRLDEDVVDHLSLPGYFRQQGWTTVANGKVFDVIADSADSWSEPVWSPGDDWHGKEPDGRGEHLQAAYIGSVNGARLPYFEKLAVADTEYPDGQVAQKSVDDLKRLSADSAPFFLTVGFRKPHLPFNAPKRYWQDAPSAQEILPATWSAPSALAPSSAFHRSMELRSQYDALPWFGDPDDAAAAQIVNAYHAAVRYVDAQVALVLDGLATTGEADNTLIVLFGDHGFLLGEQRMWTKHALFEPALRTPLIVSHPRISGGAEVQAVTDLLDVFPTVVELAGLAMPEHVEGVSLQPLLINPATLRRETKKGSISRWINGESVRTRSHRYTRWFDKEGATTDEMLFDLASDPYEQKNLAGDEDYAAVVAELAQYLEAQRTGPVWSDKLDDINGLWKVAASPVGGVLLLALAYPTASVVVLLIIVIGALTLLVRGWRRRRRLAS